MIRVQTQDFDIGEEIAALDNERAQIGAVVSFIGLVRDFSDGQQLGSASMTLEHYPGMTETQLTQIRDQAQARWDLDAVTIIHRVGKLMPGDQIVLVLAASGHRQNAFDAANFIMDILKTTAMFWKKEQSDDGQGSWVDARASDHKAAKRW